MNSGLIRCASLLGSVALHAGIVLGSSAEGAVPRLPKPPSVVQLAVAPRALEQKREIEKAPPPEEPEEVPKPKALLPKPLPDKPLPAKMPEAEEAPPPPEVSPPELTGDTLVNDLGEGWAAPAGNGASRQGAIHAGVSRALPEPLPVVATKVPKRVAPRSPEPLHEVPLSQLSRRPAPPSLTDALERNYPREARSIGKSGAAKVRARIEATGAIRLANVTFESSPGFGEACRRTLLGSQWSAPLDKSGKPAATWITYQCKFRVDG